LLPPFFCPPCTFQDTGWHRCLCSTLRIASRDGDSNYGDNERRESDDKALCASAQQHIASHDGDNDISYASARYHHIILRRVKAMTTTIISDNEQRVSNNKASYASARHISHCAQAHMLRVKHRRNNQPGNVKHRRARATSSNIDDLVRKRTGLSSIVRKCTSFQPSCARTRATASAMGLHKLFNGPVQH
jgi:hypothetical protein